MKHKDEISICKTCDKTVSESHPLFSQRMKNPDHNVVKYLPSSSVKELVEAAEFAEKVMSKFVEDETTVNLGTVMTMIVGLQKALKPFEEEK